MIRKDGTEYTKIRARCKKCAQAYWKSQYRNSDSKVRETLLRKVKDQNKKNIKEARIYVWNIKKTTPCIDCGLLDPIVAEFDHVNGKTCNIGLMIKNGCKTQKIQLEIDKCVIRCANCHRRKTALELGWNKDLWET